MPTKLRLATMLLLIAIPACAAAQGKGDKAEAKALPGLSEVLAELRKGGLVIYFRHGATDVSSGANDEKADLARCETQRNLSGPGRAQMAEVGKAIRALAIPLGDIHSSPFCRCKDTAQLVFGRHRVENDLFFAIGVGPEERARLTASLRRLLSTPPAKGKNNVLVSHTANLREAAAIWPKPEGVAYVFRPLAGKGFEPVAMVLPQDWAAVAKPVSPARR